MEELATCICGHQEWNIYKDRCVCCDCGREHKFDSMQATDILGEIKERNERGEEIAKALGLKQMIIGDSK
jgi:ribosomal protein L37E